MKKLIWAFQRDSNRYSAFNRDRARFYIHKTRGGFKLECNMTTIWSFKRLKDAKTVAQLLANG